MTSVSSVRVNGVLVPSHNSILWIRNKTISESKFMANLYELMIKTWKRKLIEKHKQPMDSALIHFPLFVFHISLLFM